MTEFRQAHVCRATPTKAAAFPFFYIEPAKNAEVIQPYITNGFPVDQMAPVGRPGSRLRPCRAPSIP